MAKLKAFWNKTKTFCIKYAIPVGLALLALIEILLVAKGKGGIFAWIGKLKYGGQKKAADIRYQEATKNVEEVEKKMSAIKEKTDANTATMEENKKVIEDLEKERTKFNEEAERAKTNIEELNRLVDANI